MSFTLLIGLLLIVGRPQASPKQAPCAHVKIIDRILNWGHKDVNHPRKIEAIIIHSSYNALTPDSFSIKGILQEYKNIDVSPHYIIDRSGNIYRLIYDRNIAYQAGKSRLPDGTRDVNAVSIGIEIVNTMNDSPTNAQYASLAELVECLESKYDIKYVLGHKDIAPGRKTDPWNFDWKRFDRLMKEEK
jgi:N-acetyl-anhydromuramyl-L-alanine amidase AmpD